MFKSLTSQPMANHRHYNKQCNLCPNSCKLILRHKDTAEYRFTKTVKVTNKKSDIKMRHPRPHNVITNFQMETLQAKVE